VSGGTPFGRGRNLFERLAQVGVGAAIRVMATRKQVEIRNGPNIRTFQQSVREEGNSTAVITAFLEDSGDDTYSQYSASASIY
jgi:hypothetical protein